MARVFAGFPTFLALAALTFPTLVKADDASLRALVQGGIEAILNDAQQQDAQRPVPQEGPATNPKAARPPVETLPTAEMAAIQRALLQLGYDPGPADGKAGRRTGAALSRYLTDRGLDPYQTPIRAAQAMILAEAGTGDTALTVATDAALPQPTEAAPASFTGSVVIKEGAALLMGGPSGVARDYFGDMTLGEGYAWAQSNFLKLYILKGNPGLLDDPQRTIAFATVVPLEEAQPFLANYDGSRRSSFAMQWAGDNQFQQEDSRQAFLARHRDRLLAASENLPTRFLDVRPLGLGRYDMDTQLLDIDAHPIAGVPWNWEPGLRLTLDAPLPLPPPRQWFLPPGEARRVVELGAANGDAMFGSKMLFIAFTHEIKGIRSAKGGVNFDLTTTAITVYEDVFLTKVVAQLSLSSNEVVATIGKDAQPVANDAGPEESVTPMNPPTGATDEGQLGQFEIGGVRLGVPLEEALVKAAEFMGPGIAPVEEDYPDAVLGKAVSFRIWKKDHSLQDSLTLFYDPTMEAKPLIAVARYTEVAFTDEAQAKAAVLPSLEARFGPATIVDRSIPTAYWAVSPMAKALLSEDLPFDHPCSHTDMEQAYNAPHKDPRLTTANALQDCGEMVSARILRSSVDMLLVNTDAFRGVRERQAAAAPPVEPPPPIKF